MKIFLTLFGISSGIMVGSGVVAILILIGIVPRMSQVSNTKEFVPFYEMILVIGTFLGGIMSLQDIHLNLGKFSVIISGLCYGVFLGFLSSGLTEIMDYIPVVSRRLKIPVIYLKYVIISLLIGKVLGSFLGRLII
ncbi:stage V sporulation protein AC [Romboutsia maritimum]|uniref:Stage V sporulation protein AC n=1 Tax=Romboutsia maritimum TaxID=2020948 RepID=A0A371IQ74_9FIRM|nr:stage V sporulation protein AB [Romboutsia maritimum]RDY22618.1 stage V sporulation protein AC [Romboutsia maritimum]